MSRKSKKQTYFNESWFKEKEEEIDLWIIKGSNSTSFRCKVCQPNKDKSLGEEGNHYLKHSTS